jgi:Protein of unknown function (DUF2953).
MLSYIKVSFMFHRISNDDNIKIKLELLKFIKLNFNIPYVDVFLGRDLKPGLKVRQSIKGKKKKLSQSKNVFSFETIKDYYEKARFYSSLFRNVLRYIISKTIFEDIRWKTRIGLDNAASTAVGVGALWAFKTNIINLLLHDKNVKITDITVTPDYSKPVFEVDLTCIIKIQMANIIIAGIRMIFILLHHNIIKKGGVSNERASYSRSNENYNG